MHPGGMGCTERAITLLDWSSWESGFEVALGVPVLTLFSVSSAVRGRGQRTAETPSNPKVTQLGSGEGIIRMLRSCPMDYLEEPGCPGTGGEL